jgi:prophage regulatory protein
MTFYLIPYSPHIAVLRGSNMRLLSYEDLKAKGIGYSRVHLWRLVRAGKFPAPVKLADGYRNTWVEEEVDALVAARMAARATAA